ncbi:MAG: hypothetical protein Q8L46_01690 [candidate division WWE3 bacterium]|nr:hypothetical protein [candidate division WWE3 bacterium]
MGQEGAFAQEFVFWLFGSGGKDSLYKLGAVVSFAVPSNQTNEEGAEKPHFLGKFNEGGINHNYLK